MYVVHVWMLTTPATANINTFHMQYVIVEPANLLLAYGVFGCEGARTGVINDMHPNIIFANIWNRLQLPLHSLIIFTLQILLHKRNYEKQYVCVCALLRSRTCAVSIWCAFYQATTDNATTATITSINSNDKKLNKNK